MRLSRKGKVSLFVVVTVLGFGVAAYAFWTGSGAGTGSASAATPASLTVNQTNAAITNLFPGGPAKALSGTFDNPNAGAVYVHDVSAVVHTYSSQADGSKPACTQADFSIGGTATVNAQVAAGNGVGSWSGLTVSMVNNASANQDNCKGVSIQIDYSANGS
jgi:hypothetical protein